MESKEEEDDLFVTEMFRWKIQNFSNLKNDKHYSDVFTIAALKWRILINPQGFSVYLGVADASTLPHGWTRCARFSLTVVNQLDKKKSITKPAKGSSLQVFEKGATEWGYKSVMPSSKLYDRSAGYLVNDICIVEVKIDVPFKIDGQGLDVSAPMESSNLNSVKIPVSSAAPKVPRSVVVPMFQEALDSEEVSTKPTSDRPGDPSQSKDCPEVTTTTTGKVMDFRGLGKIDKAFVPLLQEVCSWHPSLIACMPKRGPKFTECAFTALGQVLHFLKTTKVKDMNEDACEHLQVLWEELESFKFNLSWLEPYVQSAFGLKKFVEKAGRVKSLSDDVYDFEIELKRRRRTLIAAEVELEITRRDLPMTGNIDMDGELGYGRS